MNLHADLERSSRSILQLRTNSSLRARDLCNSMGYRARLFRPNPKTSTERTVPRRALPRSCINHTHCGLRSGRRAPEKLPFRPSPLHHSHSVASRTEDSSHITRQESFPISEGGVHSNDDPLLRHNTTHEIRGRPYRVHLQLITLCIEHIIRIDTATFSTIPSSRRGRMEILRWNQRGNKRAKAGTKEPCQSARRLCQTGHGPHRAWV